MNRKYKSTKPITARIDGGPVFAHEIFGENTRVQFTERRQGEGSYNGQKWNQLLFSIKFKDVGFSMTCKSKDIWQDQKIFVEYGLAVMEEESLEEYYKAVLMITKIHLENSFY